MLKIKEAVVVEGRHDKIALSELIDTLIVSVGGFSVYGDKNKISLLRMLAQKRGIIIFTDSDWAGRRIRSYIKSCISSGVVKHAYIPQISGKERRKSKSSAEGFLGVEGVSKTLLTDILCKVGVMAECTDKTSDFCVEKVSSSETNKVPGGMIITKTDFYNDGLTGTSFSAEKRRKLCAFFGLPENLSSNSLIQLLNSAYSPEEYNNAVKSIDEKINSTS